jgi:hypothetical protein
MNQNWRAEISGRAAIKTKLKRNGFKVNRAFYGRGCVCKKGGRLYRFRFWSNPQMVDISDTAFDRWANSTERSVLLGEFMKEVK